MPTGYTSVIDDTEGDVSLRVYAIRCAHAFGALIHRRDSGFQDDIPDTVAPLAGDYHVNAHRAAIDELARVADMTPAECDAKAKAEHVSRCASYAESRARTAASVAKYQAMREKVQAWSPPIEVENLKRFMLHQLEIGAPYLFREPDPAERDGAAWRAEEVARLRRDIAYHAEHIADDQRRADECTAWLRALRKSLDEADAV